MSLERDLGDAGQTALGLTARLLGRQIKEHGPVRVPRVTRGIIAVYDVLEAGAFAIGRRARSVARRLSP